MSPWFLNADELAFYDALANNAEAVREMGDEILKKIAHELAESLRRNVSVDWSVRENVRAKLRLMVKRILRKYKYPPDREEAAVQLVLDQAETLSAEWEVVGAGPTTEYLPVQPNSVGSNMGEVIVECPNV
ncbi:type I restriction enzyme endonuclease domain-containing protein [Citrifermentans bremense]|nr:type I restriction enzyme endonuclease domain-containing protein [Citrifermentans bremense]